MTTIAVVINDLANSWTHRQCNYFWGCRQFRRRLKKSPINDFFFLRGAGGILADSTEWPRGVLIKAEQQELISLSLSPPPCRTVSPELKSYALGVLFLLLRLLGRFKTCMSFSLNLCPLMEHSIFNMQKLISTPCSAVVVTSGVWHIGVQALSMRDVTSRLLKALFLLFVLC